MDSAVMTKDGATINMPDSPVELPNFRNGYLS
jgi:hypothetical protein